MHSDLWLIINTHPRSMQKLKLASFSPINAVMQWIHSPWDLSLCMKSTLRICCLLMAYLGFIPGAGDMILTFHNMSSATAVYPQHQFRGLWFPNAGLSRSQILGYCISSWKKSSLANFQNQISVLNFWKINDTVYPCQTWRKVAVG